LERDCARGLTKPEKVTALYLEAFSCPDVERGRGREHGHEGGEPIDE